MHQIAFLFEKNKPSPDGIFPAEEGLKISMFNPEKYPG